MRLPRCAALRAVRRWCSGGLNGDRQVGVIPVVTLGIVIAEDDESLSIRFRQVAGDALHITWGRLDGFCLHRHRHEECRKEEGNMTILFIRIAFSPFIPI